MTRFTFLNPLQLLGCSLYKEYQPTGFSFSRTTTLHLYFLFLYFAVIVTVPGFLALILPFETVAVFLFDVLHFTFFALAPLSLIVLLSPVFMLRLFPLSLITFFFENLTMTDFFPAAFLSPFGFVRQYMKQAQESQVYDYSDRNKIQFPFYDVKYFIQEKYKIAGDKPGSGNTENIGSFSTKKFSDLKDGKGPFNSLGADAFDIYWKYYPKYRSENKAYTSLPEFVLWFPKQLPAEIQLFHPYDYEETKRRIQAYAEMLNL